MEAALVILDGWGLGDGGPGDAVSAADTPVFDGLRAAAASGTLRTHGRAVGLPDGQMGNSEVGHLNIGAGRVLKQDSTRITDDIDAGTFADNPAIAETMAAADRNGGTVHFAGLLSDGGVHSYQSHLHALIETAADRGVDAVTHAFTDGRDTPPDGGTGYAAELRSVVERHGTGRVATVVGRYYAMDRDRNWDRTKRAYDAVVDRAAPHEADSARAAIEAAYDRGETDEYVEPTLVRGPGDAEEPALSEGDAVVCFNFRADRVRQLVRMLADIDPEWPFDTDPPDVEVVTMTEYDERFGLPVAYPPIEPERTLGEALSAAGLTQLRAAESEKYAHVTYFLNGGREVAFDGERREIVPSPDVATYDERPEMSAPELTDAVLEAIDAGAVDVLVCNYANPDMVGHTGEFDAAVAAVEAVDCQLGRLREAVTNAGGDLLVTADHGNADDMGTPEAPHTAHTTNPVPFVYATPEGTDGGLSVRSGGALADVAPTLLSLIGVDIPAAMTGERLLR
ncbi:2,3-bisphosphoglycerate-independent phosphoglycerate mutase [Natronomonas sp.]|uniref:2,3-bisphosphoglycerate-independent phosphoglycerate mutase n=1 Tax=Natronomonas sp. TaxID=2184060 RepID=UPI002619472A|nr:2,3-bisphosphoglycerate-independent phosphoglycerate mutase [Natronomonas sp.]